MRHLPTIAGLKIFWPNPPKTIFPMATPETMPMMAIQKGMVGGREREKIRHVTKTADVTGFASRKVKRASVAIPKRKTVAIKAKDLQPKRYMDVSTRGTNA
jgi:hypothetical protein